MSDKTESIRQLWAAVDKKDDTILNEKLSTLRCDFKNITTKHIENCLLSIIYLSSFERKVKGPNFISLPGNLTVDIKRADAREQLFWSVSRWRELFFLKTPSLWSLGMEEVRIEESWKRVTACLLLRLLDAPPPLEGLLPDGTPIVNAIILAGVKFQLNNNTEDLLQKFITQIDQGLREKSQVQKLCPYSQESAIDVLIRSSYRGDVKKIHFDLLKLYKVEAKPNLKSANFFKIVEEIRASNSGIEIRIPEFPKRQDLIIGTKLIENEIRSMVKEKEYKEKVKSAFVPLWEFGKANSKEGKITENIVIWLQNALKSCKNRFPDIGEVCKLYLSGSISEGCRLKTKNEDVRDLGTEEYEIDLILAAHLDIQPVLTDADLCGGFMGHHNHRSQVQTELCKPQAKNPFPHVGRIELTKNYKSLGKKDEVLEAEKFFKNMTEYVEHALSFCTDGKVPHGLDPVDDIRNCVELTRSGLVLSFTYKGTKVSVDVVNCIPLRKFWIKEIVRIFPGYDRRKLQFLEQYFSCHDGVIVKEGAWRLSFSNSEAKLLRRLDGDNHIYKVLKFLANRSGQAINSYFIKEVALSYIVHTAMNNVNQEKDQNLVDTLNNMFAFAEDNRISNPFYCNRLGSRMHQDTKDLKMMFLIGRCNLERHYERVQNHFERTRNSSSISNLMSAIPCSLSPLEASQFDESFENDDDDSNNKKIENLVAKLIQVINKSKNDTKVDIQIQNKSLNINWTNSFSNPLRRVSIPPRRSSNFYLRNIVNRGHYLQDFHRRNKSGVSNFGFVSDSEDEQSCSTSSVLSFSIGEDENEVIDTVSFLQDDDDVNNDGEANGYIQSWEVFELKL